MAISLAIPTLKIDASVNETKPEQTTTKVMEKHMDSIQSVIQDTMKTVHENIDKVQSNVDKVHTDVRRLEPNNLSAHSSLSTISLCLALLNCVCTVATNLRRIKSCSNLPDEYVTKQVVIKLCQGCIDNILAVLQHLFNQKQ
jgi:septation ring formation regulator EzrA